MSRHRRLRRTVFATVLAGAAALPLAPAADAANAACFVVGSPRSAFSNWGANALSASDQGFRSLNSNHAYTLYVKGVEQKMYHPYDTRLWYYRFVPQRFAVLGASEARSGGNPAGQALGSITTIKLFSTKTSAQFGLSFPLGISVAWELQNRVRVIQSKAWNDTGLSKRSAEFGWANPLTGVAGTSSGLYRVDARSGAIPGADTGPYWTAATSSWSVGNRYDSPYKQQNYAGLSRTGCNYVAWGN